MSAMPSLGTPREGDKTLKLFLKAALAAARGDKDRTYEIMLEVVKEMEKA